MTIAPYNRLALLVVLAVNLSRVESEARTCYFGAPPEPRPGEHWMKAAVREIRKRCPGNRAPAGLHVEPITKPLTLSSATSDLSVQASTMRTASVGPTTYSPVTTTNPSSTIIDTQSTTNDPFCTTTYQPSTTTDTPDNRPADCQAVYDAGSNTNGVYTIFPPQYPNGFQVYCHMGEKKKWTTFQRRWDGSVNFTRNWTDYRDGFGDPAGEFWLGNEKLRRLTEEGEWKLGIRLKETGSGNGNDPKHTVYQHFRIVGCNYTLSNGPRGGLLDILEDALSLTHTNQPFSTYDHDNDADTIANCAELLKGGWWFKTCTGGSGDLVQSNLNGEYQDMRWGSREITESTMALRRVS